MRLLILLQLGFRGTSADGLKAAHTDGIDCPSCVIVPVNELLVHGEPHMRSACTFARFADVSVVTMHPQTDKLLLLLLRDLL